MAEYEKATGGSKPLQSSTTNGESGSDLHQTQMIVARQRRAAMRKADSDTEEPAAESETETAQDGAAHEGGAQESEAEEQEKEAPAEAPAEEAPEVATKSKGSYPVSELRRSLHRKAVSSEAGAPAIEQKIGGVQRKVFRAIVVSTASSVGGGKVRAGGKLESVLKAIEAGYAAPKNAFDALGIIKRATQSVGLDVGVATPNPDGSINLANFGGVDTHITKTGAIIIKNKDGAVVLHLTP